MILHAGLFLLLFFFKLGYINIYKQKVGVN